uniref:uncharacterized protein LOC122589827 n=1 Tax=Erigeron canadensis TaxID=72917 RepID=UPI001CB8C858|nr:uncharacterized protein LOC122589827 [Erigeron canadensis]
MPKIADMKCPKSSRSKRKPLRDISTNPNASTFVMKKKPNNNKNTHPQQHSSGPMDRLLLAHSQLSVLIHQIDELVVQAVDRKVSNTKDVEMFADVLQEMQTSLKPWVPRFQKVLSTSATGSDNQLEKSFANMNIAPSRNEELSKAIDSPYLDKLDFMVSPSPLVSWRDDGAADGGRNLFMLTPLPRPTPFTSRLKKSSKSVFKKINDDVTIGNNAVTVGPVESVFSSTEKLIQRKNSVVVSTPCLKMSPPKSCILLEPASECCNKINGTKNPTIHHPLGGGSGGSEPSSSEPSDLALKYPELFGIRRANKLGNARNVVEESPGWGFSPPKTCVLLEPGDDLSNDTNLTRAGDYKSVVSRNEVIESTPMCKDFDTTILKGKCAGENTLKKELWMRIEATIAYKFPPKASVDQGTANTSTSRGFMDLLEEASSDDPKSIV